MTITPPPDRGDRALSLDRPRCGHHSARLSREHPGAGRKRQHFFGLKARAPRQHRHRYRHARPRLHSGEAGGHRQGRQSPDLHRPGRRPLCPGTELHPRTDRHLPLSGFPLRRDPPSLIKIPTPSPRGGYFFCDAGERGGDGGKVQWSAFLSLFPGGINAFFAKRGLLYGGFALFSPDLPAFSGEKPCFRAKMEPFPGKRVSKHPPPANGRGRAASGAGLREFTCDTRARGR